MNALQHAARRIATRHAPGVWIGAIVKAFEAQHVEQADGRVEHLPPHYLIALWEPLPEGAVMLPRWPAVAAIAPRDANEALIALVRHVPAPARAWLTEQPIDWSLVARIVLGSDPFLEPYQRSGLEAFVARCEAADRDEIARHYSHRDEAFEAMKARLLGAEGVP